MHACKCALLEVGVRGVKTGEMAIGAEAQAGGED